MLAGDPCFYSDERKSGRLPIVNLLAFDAAFTKLLWPLKCKTFGFFVSKMLALVADIIRLHRMHQMRTIGVDDPGDCLSVCHTDGLCNNG